MSKIQHEVAVVYTDGSHFPDPQGTGTGIHVYAYDRAGRDKLANDYGAIDPHVPEILTVSGYKPMPPSVITKVLPVLEDSDTAIYECVYPLSPSTAQVAELTAFLAIFDKNAPFSAKEYHIHTDSNYLLNGIKSWMRGWKKNNWVKGNGEPVINVEIWKAILKKYDEVTGNGIKVNLYKIKGHNDHYGNERADVLAKRGSAVSVAKFAKGDKVYLPQWTNVSELDNGEAEMAATEHDAPKVTPPKGKTTKSALEEKLLPPIASQKLFYILSNEKSPTVTIDGKTWHYCLSGDHAKNKDDLALVGKFIPDTMFAVTFTEEPFDTLYKIANSHATRAWGDTPLMARYDTVAIISGLHVNRKKFCSGWRTGLDLDQLELRENGNVMMFDNKTYISELARPPLLSYRSIEIRDELAGRLKDIIEDDPHYIKTDITDKLFDEEGKPTKFYRNVDRSISFMVDHECGNKPAKVILSRGIDIPSRTDINRIKSPEGRYYIVTWKQCARIFRYAVVYESPTENALWMGYYSALRLLTDNDL